MGHPLACAVGCAVIDVLREDRLVEHAAEIMGQYFAARSGRIREHPTVVDLRGIGLLRVGAKLAGMDRATRLFFPAPVRRRAEAAGDRAAQRARALRHALRITPGARAAARSAALHRAAAGHHARGDRRADRSSRRNAGRMGIGAGRALRKAVCQRPASHHIGRSDPADRIGRLEGWRERAQAQVGRR